MIDYLNTGCDPDELNAPTLILLCGFCAREIAFIGDSDEDVIDGCYTLGEYELVACDCGAVYGEGDTIEVLKEA